MTLEEVRAMFGWCAILNFALFLWWAGFIIFAHDWVHRMHSKWFNLSAERFDTIHYSGMAFFKICIFVFNVVPYLALRIVG